MSGPRGRLARAADLAALAAAGAVLVELAGTWHARRLAAQHAAATMRRMSAELRARLREPGWWNAPLPPRRHTCSVVAAGRVEGLGLVARCACGAIRVNRGRWHERNSRRAAELARAAAAAAATTPQELDELTATIRRNGADLTRLVNIARSRNPTDPVGKD